jgi:hypothetical protein
MSFIKTLTVNGVNYYSLVESVREGGKVHHKLVRYFGKELPVAYLIDKLKKKKKMEKMNRGLTSERKLRTIRINTCDCIALESLKSKVGMNTRSMADVVHLLVEQYQNSMHPPA